jgi:hypothetical protein
MKRLIKKAEIINPEQLLNFMKDNFSYGYVDKNGKIHEQIDDNVFYNNYKLQSPKELLESKIGVCWDQAEFERYYFEKFNIKYQVLYIEQKNKDESTHTFVVFEQNNKYFWFEHSYEYYKGIHGPFNNIKDIINLVHEHMLNDNKDNGFVCYVLNKPQYGITTKQFMDFAVSGKKII